MNAIETELAGIEARANAATAGPWKTELYDVLYADDEQPGGFNWGGEFGSVEDAEFAAASRTDVPRLVAALRRACYEIDMLDKASTGFGMSSQLKPILAILTGEQEQR